MSLTLKYAILLQIEIAAAAGLRAYRYDGRLLLRVRICCYGNGRTCGQIPRPLLRSPQLPSSILLDWPTATPFLLSGPNCRGRTLSFCAPVRSISPLPLLRGSLQGGPLYYIILGGKTCPFSGHVLAIRFCRSFHSSSKFLAATMNEWQSLCTSP